MSRVPPPGGPGRPPYGGPGLPGANPRMPPQGQGYGSPQGYGAPQGYGDPRAPQRQAPPGQGRYGEKGPSGGGGGGGGRQVSLRVEKVADKTLQGRLIYGNL